MLGQILVRIGADIGDLTRDLQQASGQLRSFGSNASSMGGQISATFGVAGAAIAGGLGAAVSTAADFDTAMRKAGAIAGASASELDAMKQSALELGASTSQSASGVANAMTEMAAKGYDANQVIAAMPGVISAAEASGEDLALAADTVASALNIFGMEASESGKVADILAQTANSTAAGIGDMSYALKYAGAPAAALGISLEETSAAIGLMTNAGIDGSSAGTALRASLLALNNPATEQAKMMKKLGVSLYDSEGNMKSISGIVETLTGRMEGMTEAEKTATLAKLVGTEAVSGFLALMDAGPAKIDAMTASLENSAGASAKTAEEMKAGIGGAMEEMSGAIETFAIMVGNQLVPYVQQAANFIAGLANAFNNASPAVQQFLTFGAVLVAALAGIVAVGGALVFIVGNIITAFGAISGVVSTVVAAFSTGGAAAGALGTAFAAITGPIGIAIAVIVGLAAVFITAYKKCEWFRDMVNSAWNAIKDTAVKAFTTLKNAVTDAIGGIVSFGKSQLKVFTDLWSDHGSQISGYMKTALETISVLFTVQFGLMKTAVVTAWNVIKGATTVVWAVIKAAVSTAINLVAGILRTMMSVIKGDWKGAWESVKQTVSNIVKGIVSAFKGVNLLQIGKDIINGLIKGISSMAGEVKKKVAALADKIPQWAKDKLGIHSPSRVLRDEVGRWIPAGVAVGIESGIGLVKKAANAMAGASVPDFSTDLKLAERDRKAAQGIVSKAISGDAKELKAIRSDSAKDTAKIEKAANEKIVKLKRDAANKVANLTKKSKTTSKQIYATMNAQIKKVEEKKAEDLLKIDKKLSTSVNKITSSTNADKMKALKEYAEAQKQSNNMSIAQEAAYWNYVAKSFKNGTKEKTEALKKFNAASSELMKEQFENEKAWIEERKNLNAISLREEVLAYNKYVKGYGKGTEAYNYYTKAMYDTRQEIADKLVSTNESYVNRMKQINDTLLADEQRLTDEYKSELDNRYNTIKGYYGLFDEVKASERVEGSTLTKNLSEQVAALSEWQLQLNSIKGRGVAGALLDDLTALGVDATAELQALNRMTDAELTQYQEIYATKMEIARNAAVEQLKPLQAETASKIEALRKTANEELFKLEADWSKEIDKVVNGTGDKLNTLREVGAFAIKGLRDGMLSMKGGLQSAANSLANAIEQSIRSSLKIHSPSRLLRALGVHTGEGLELGLYDMEASVAKAALQLAEAATPNIEPMNLTGFTSNATSQIESKLQAQFKDDETRRQGDFVLQVDGYELARVQKSHIGGMMQRDASLRTKVRGL